VGLRREVLDGHAIPVRTAAIQDDDLEYPAQEQEERRTMLIGFKFPRGLKNSVITFQHPAMTNPIDGPA
jgi:hypothetical protein